MLKHIESFLECKAYNVSRNNLPSFDLVFLPISNHHSFYNNVSSETCHHICGLILLVPSNGGVEKKASNDHAEFDPITESG